MPFLVGSYLIISAAALYRELIRLMWAQRQKSPIFEIFRVKLYEAVKQRYAYVSQKNWFGNLYIYCLLITGSTADPLYNDTVCYQRFCC